MLNIIGFLYCQENYLRKPYFSRGTKKNCQTIRYPIFWQNLYDGGNFPDNARMLGGGGEPHPGGVERGFL